MNAYLLLANGMVFAGQSVGAEGVTVGEVVFAAGIWPMTFSWFGRLGRKKPASGASD